MSTEVFMPQMGESIAEGTVTRWLKQVGDRITLDEPLFEISTDKIDAEIPAPVAGILAQILVKENETVPINTAVAVIEVDSQNTRSLQEYSTETPPSRSATGTGAQTVNVSSASEGSSEKPQKPPLSSPFVRRIAREHGLSLAELQGSGELGRITKKDVLQHVGNAPLDVAPPGDAESSTGLVFDGSTAVVEMSAMRRQIADRMLASRRTSAHVTTVFEVDLMEVVQIRERSKEEFQKRHGTRLNYTAFFVRAAAVAIRSFPIFNASVEGTKIVYKRDVNIGVAVALHSGLIVPVIRLADEKSLLAVALAVQDLAERARSKRLRVDEVQDGTFTITNPGMFGSLIGSPIIQQPQVAILAVGAIQQRVVVRNSAITIRPMAYLSLSYDHRIIDGAIGAQFLGKIKAALENWNEPVL